jgi:hypothetical protein
MENKFILQFLPFVGFLIYLVLIQRANQKLDPNKKAELMTLSSSNRLLTYGLFIGIVLITSMGRGMYHRYKFINPSNLFFVFISLIFMYIFYRSYSLFQILKNNNFPDFYLKSHIISNAILLLSIAATSLLILL